MIILEELTAINFMSYLNLELKFNAGLWFIEGEHLNSNVCSSNEVGKTSLFDAIYWCWFESTTKDVLVDDVVNWDMGKNCMVSIKAKADGKEFTVTRFRRHSKYENECHVYLDGIKQPGDPQKVIQGILKMSSKLFLYSCLLSQGFNQNFTQMGQTERKGIFEESLNLTVLRHAHAITKQRKVNVEDVLEKSVGKLSIYTEEIERDKKELTSLHILKDEWKKDLENKAVSINNELHNLERQRNTRVKHVGVLDDLYIEREKKQETLQKFKGISLPKDTFIDKPCPFCSKLFTREDYQKLIPDNPAGRAMQIALLNAELNSVKQKITDIENIKLEIARIDGAIEALQSKREGIKGVNPYTQQIEQKETSIKSYELAIENIQDDMQDKILEQMSLTYWLDAFSPLGGIRHSIIQYYLPILNSIIEKYSKSIMGENWSISLEGFRFTQKKEVKDELSIKIIKDGAERQYKNLSSGRKARIDLVVFLSYQEMIFNFSNPINILMIDEAFSTVDRKGMPSIIEVLKKVLDKNRTVFFIHQDTSYAPLFENKIKVVYEDGISRIAHDH